MLDILIKDHAGTDVAVFGMSQPDVTLALKQPWVSICDDSAAQAPTGPLGQGHPHPRAYAAFPRIISKYVRKDHVLTLADAIRKMTALPTQRMGLTQRGVLKKGMWADIFIFDPAKLSAPRHIRDAETACAGNERRAGQWRAGDRRRPDDARVAGKGSARPRVQGRRAPLTRPG